MQQADTWVESVWGRSGNRMGQAGFSQPSAISGWGLALTRSRRVCAFVWQRSQPMWGVYLGPGECDFSGSGSTPGRLLEMRCLRLHRRPPASGSAFSQDAGEVHVHIQVQACLPHAGRRAPCRSWRRLANTRLGGILIQTPASSLVTGVRAQSPC